MAPTRPALLLVAALVLLAGSRPAFGQVAPPVQVPIPPPPPPPPPSSGGGPTTVPAPVAVPTPGAPAAPTWLPAPPAGPGTVPPPPPPPACDPCGGFLNRGPMPFGPYCPPDGWFASLELGLLTARFHNRLSMPVSVGGVTSTVTVPGIPLDWTGSPRLEIGYRLPSGVGAFLASYRSLVTSGSATEAGFDGAGPGFLKSRLNLNVVDLEYRNGPWQFAPLWYLTWDAGARIGTAYYDSSATGLQVTERITNNFVGGGPIAGVELARQLADFPGIALFGRLQGGGMFGRVAQSAEVSQQVPGGPLIGGANVAAHSQTVPFFAFFTGVSYTPPVRNRWMRFSLGYEYEQWWNIGDLHNAPSKGDLTMQGIFFRADFSF